jgi:hypothetical protein
MPAAVQGRNFGPDTRAALDSAQTPVLTMNAAPKVAVVKP